jgi:multidrug resistance efflux pump
MEEDKLNKRRKWSRKRVAIFGLFGSIFLFFGIYSGIKWIIFRLHYVTTDDAQVKGNLIYVSSKVAGRIAKFHVDEGDHVSKGQLIAELEKDDYVASRNQAKAQLEMAKNDLERAIYQLSLTRERVNRAIETSQASLREAEEGLKFAKEDASLQIDRVRREIERAEASYKASIARVMEAKSQMENARKEYERAKELFRNNYIAENQKDFAETQFQVAESRYRVALENEKEAISQLDLARANERSIELKMQMVRIAQETREKARLSLDLAKEEIKQIEIQERNVEILKAKVKEAQALFEISEIRLGETRVFSPISGVVSKRLADRGEMVQAGQPLLVLNDPTEKWVVANVEETKVRKVRQGAQARIEADAFPGKPFEGRVEFIGSAAISEFALLPAENPSGNFVKITHRLPVRISVRDPENLLKPGMMVIAAIKAHP